MDKLLNFSERITEIFYDDKEKKIDFSKKHNISLSIIHRWCRGVSYPTVKHLISISEYFTCSCDFILNRVQEKYPFVATNLSSFPNRLNSLLIEKNISQYRLNKDTMLANETIRDWRNGKSMPYAESLIVLADYFDCTIDYLLGREN